MAKATNSSSTKTGQQDTPAVQEVKRRLVSKRRDLLDASKLLVQNKVCKPGEIDGTALTLGTQYLREKRAGETDLDFAEWLDEDIEDDEDDEGEDPTPGS